MARKRPRLAVLITDSCNLQVPSGMGPGPSPMLMPPRRITPLFETLFIRSRGVVDINSSSEGQVSVGAIGGGLLTLSLAYLGNQPNFRPYPGFTRPPRSTRPNRTGAKIPSVDHSMAMAEFFGGQTEHGLHGNFDPDKPPFGIWFAYQDQNLNWEAVRGLLDKKVHALFKIAAPKGWDNGEKVQKTQTPRFYSLPKTEGGTSRVRPLRETRKPPREQVGGPRPLPRRWSRPIYRPEVGDRITEVNGQPIRNMNDYIRAVKNSPKTMTFVLWEARTGKTFVLRTQLNPSNANSRFGVGAEDVRGLGVRVKFVMQGYPGTRCQLAQ
jgi:hypothetical protein